MDGETNAKAVNSNLTPCWSIPFSRKGQDPDDTEQ